MSEFCDVAVPVPLDATFTYRVGETEPVVGGRVLVPFRAERMVGVVTKLHDNAPQSHDKKIQVKTVIAALDSEAVLDAGLLKLGEWIAQYYIAPIGEVFRSMLPLTAEVKKQIVYRIAEPGHEVLAAGAGIGSSLRSHRSEAEQDLEYKALDYLAQHDSASENSLRAAVQIPKSLLLGMVRKKWIARADESSIRDARRTIEVAVLKEGGGGRQVAGKGLNANQQAIVAALRESGGRMPVDQLRELLIPRTTLQTLIKRNLVEIIEEPATFEVSSLKPRAVDDLKLTSKQKEALGKINTAAADRKFSVTLLHGVTGSGKTAIYLAAMKAVLAAGKAAIMLVPEIGLTPAAAANLHHLFKDDVAILHSGLSADERAEQWHRIRRRKARIVVGTRSAIFAPVKTEDLALIVVDEEHDTSYKQEETPRYHGRDVAVMRGKLSGAAVVLGSATPSLESYHNAQKGKYHLIELRERVEQRPLPKVEVLDMRSEFQQKNKEEDVLFSTGLTQAVRERLARGEQAMVLLNRRGYAPVVLCRSCGQTVQCENCAIALTHHKRDNKLECHYCGFKRAVPRVCPHCQSEYIYFIGAGSEKLEDRLHGLFPSARIGRMDRDTVRGKADFERMLSSFDNGELDLLVGTQMIAKGHDIHGVTLVGVVGADFALGFPDFRAAERTFQLLTQVAGRAGRGDTPGEVILQTYSPEHYAIQYAAKHDYAAFFEKELQFRRWMHYPPFTAIANVLVRSDNLAHALRWSGEIGKWFDKNKTNGLRVMGPAVAPLSRLKGDHRYHFVLKSASRPALNESLRKLVSFSAVQKIPRTNLVIDVDAISLM
jgi:primosomal protein N' (replication factor Y) (superfamily II helicase)